jgi:hypothetical protein
MPTGAPDADRRPEETGAPEGTGAPNARDPPTGTIADADRNP